MRTACAWRCQRASSSGWGDGGGGWTSERASRTGGRGTGAQGRRSWKCTRPWETVRPEPPLPSGLFGLQRERSVAHGAGALEPLNHDAGSGDLGVQQPERRRQRSAGEEPLARGEHEGEGPEPDLIDEVVLQQRLDQVAAARYLNLTLAIPLEPTYIGDDIANDRGILPLGAAQGARRDHFGHRVQLERDGIRRIGDARPVRGEDLI